MPLYHQFSYKNSEILLWKFSDEDYFDEAKLLIGEDYERIENYHPRKKSEFLMVRRLLQLQLPNHKIFYESEGRPILKPADWEISISHSFPFAAISVTHQKTGIDVERITDKIVRVKHKFLHESEVEWLGDTFENEYLTAIWAIKEALYKLHPSKLWSLKKHYSVTPFVLNEIEKEVKCTVFSDDFRDDFTAKLIRFENYYLAVIVAD